MLPFTSNHSVASENEPVVGVLRLVVGADLEPGGLQRAGEEAAAESRKTDLEAVIVAGNRAVIADQIAAMGEEVKAEQIIAKPAGQIVGTAAADQCIGSVAARKRVDTADAAQKVGGAIADQHVGADDRAGKILDAGKAVAHPRSRRIDRPT